MAVYELIEVKNSIYSVSNYFYSSDRKLTQVGILEPRFRDLKQVRALNGGQVPHPEVGYTG